jgi:hypothetical protein
MAHAARGLLELQLVAAQGKAFIGRLGPAAQDSDSHGRLLRRFEPTLGALWRAGQP